MNKEQKIESLSAKERVQKALETLKAGVQKLVSSDEWKRHLRFMRNFRDYSWNNTFLIAIQKPEATRVAGFNTWKKLGRMVKKGEKALWILAPAPYTREVTVKVIDPKTGAETEEQEERKFMGFRPVPVFDISQTEGLELPSLCKKLEGDDTVELWNQLVTFAQEKGCPVVVKEMARANGSYHLVNHKITVEERNALNQRTKTLIHEIAHHLHESSGVAHSHEEGELVAESVAFVVADHFGLDTSSYSFGYLAGWAGGDASKLHKVGDMIQKVSSEILDALDPQEEVTVDPEEAEKALKAVEEQHRLEKARRKAAREAAQAVAEVA